MTNGGWQAGGQVVAGGGQGVEYDAADRRWPFVASEPVRHARHPILPTPRIEQGRTQTRSARRHPSTVTFTGRVRAQTRRPQRTGWNLKEEALSTIVAPAYRRQSSECTSGVRSGRHHQSGAASMRYHAYATHLLEAGMAVKPTAAVIGTSGYGQHPGIPALATALHGT